MGHFYFTRHGQTVWNVENKICGASDSPLTELGREQARALGNDIKARQLEIDEILYAPLSRAAHNGIARAVESYFRDMTNEEFAAFGIKNCEIRRYDW